MAVTAGAARAKAEVEAAYLVAINRPRDVQKAKQRILTACSNSTFAEEALWNRIVGRQKNEKTGQWEDAWGEGLNIRFAEEAIQAMGNIRPASDLVYEDAETKVIKITITDLEANVSYSKDVTIQKTVERSTLKRGQIALAERTNSRGQKVYIVAATEMDMRNKQSAAESIIMRTNGLRLLPADIKAEALKAIKQTILAKEKAEPGAIGRLLKSFEEFGATKEQLDELLGHDLAQVTGEEIVKLRGLYRAIKDGETTWNETINAKVDVRPAPEEGSLSMDDISPGSESEHTDVKKPMRPATEDIKPEGGLFNQSEVSDEDRKTLLNSLVKALVKKGVRQKARQDEATAAMCQHVGAPNVQGIKGLDQFNAALNWIDETWGE